MVSESGDISFLGTQGVASLGFPAPQGLLCQWIGSVVVHGSERSGGGRAGQDPWVPPSAVCFAVMF